LICQTLSFDGVKLRRLLKAIILFGIVAQSWAQTTQYFDFSIFLGDQKTWVNFPITIDGEKNKSFPFIPVYTDKGLKKLCRDEIHARCENGMREYCVSDGELRISLGNINYKMVNSYGLYAILDNNNELNQGVYAQVLIEPPNGIHANIHHLIREQRERAIIIDEVRGIQWMTLYKRVEEVACNVEVVPVSVKPKDPELVVEMIPDPPKRIKREPKEEPPAIPNDFIELFKEKHKIIVSVDVSSSIGQGCVSERCIQVIENDLPQFLEMVPNSVEVAVVYFDGDKAYVNHELSKPSDIYSGNFIESISNEIGESRENGYDVKGMVQRVKQNKNFNYKHASLFNFYEGAEAVFLFTDGDSRVKESHPLSARANYPLYIIQLETESLDEDFLKSLSIKNNGELFTVESLLSRVTLALSRLGIIDN